MSPSRFAENYILLFESALSHPAIASRIAQLKSDRWTIAIALECDGTWSDEALADVRKRLCSVGADVAAVVLGEGYRCALVGADSVSICQYDRDADKVEPGRFRSPGTGVLDVIDHCAGDGAIWVVSDRAEDVQAVNDAGWECCSVEAFVSEGDRVNST